MIKTFPLASISLDEAKEKQFTLVDTITKHFEGQELLNSGDLGLVSGYGKPQSTLKVESVLADFFKAEKAVLVRGAGTAAIKWASYAILQDLPFDKRIVLVHQAPVYPTTKIIFDMLAVKTIEADFNNLDSLKNVLATNKDIAMALVQYTRQKIDDSYDMGEVLSTIKKASIPIVSDDNYAVMKVPAIGVELGASLSAFSAFKLLGPEGIGCIVGVAHYIDKIVKCQYSGGSQVQGHEAMSLLQGLVYAPVALAVQAEVNNELHKQLNNGILPFVKKAYLVNAQSKVVVVELKENLAKAIIAKASKLGALPYPVGAESKYEIAPLFYQVSGTFRATDSTLEERMIRINPNRAGSSTIINILKQSYDSVKGD